MKVGDDVIKALQPAAEGRPDDAPLLERWRHRQTDPTTWVKVGRLACKTASKMRLWWQKVVEVAAYPDVIPYALRHSSIVRAIRAGFSVDVRD